MLIAPAHDDSEAMVVSTNSISPVKLLLCQLYRGRSSWRRWRSP